MLNKKLHALKWMYNKISCNSAMPVLIIGTTQDPPSPNGWAKGLSNFIQDSHLVRHKGESHTAYGRGNRDVDDLIDGYLLGISK